MGVLVSDMAEGNTVQKTDRTMREKKKEPNLSLAVGGGQRQNQRQTSQIGATSEDEQGTTKTH